MNTSILPTDKEYKDRVMQMWKGTESDPEAISDASYVTPFFYNVLNLSPCVTWIMDIRTQKYVFITANTIDYFGYDHTNYMTHGQRYHEEMVHPDDKINNWKLMYKVWKVLMTIPSASKSNYKFSYDYRILKPDGSIARILEQNAVFRQDVHGNVTHLLGVCNDITQWKKTEVQLASLSSDTDKKYFLFDSDTHNELKANKILSKRELEIVKLMSEGHSSKYIADKLFISFHTVNTHRQKMIEKTNAGNTGGLIQFVMFNGLI